MVIRMRPVLAAFAALLAIATAACTANTAGAATPVAHIDTAYQVGNTVTIKGWGYSPANPGRALQIGAKVDGRNTATTNTSRQQYRPGGAHPLTASTVIPVGVHVVCFNGRLPGTGQAVQLGCLRTTGVPLSTAADLRTEAALVDPRHTVRWSIGGTTQQDHSATAYPWNNRVVIASDVPRTQLRMVVRHEYGHILQWRFFGSTTAGWNRGLTTLNRLSGTGNGVEHSADCIALMLGATGGTGYGCLGSLVPVSSRIAALA